MVSSTLQTESQEMDGSCRTTNERRIGVAHEEDAHQKMLLVRYRRSLPSLVRGHEKVALAHFP
jgi:hypothetical protein